MASSMKKTKLSETDSSKEFHTWWSNRYINKNSKAICILSSGTVVCRTSSVERHYRINHKSLLKQSYSTAE